MEKRKRKAQERKYKEWQRKYQASVAAFSLDIGISPKKAKRLKKRWVGAEIRPMIVKPNNFAKDYSQRLSKAFAI